MQIKIDYQAMVDANTRIAEFHVDLARQYLNAGDIHMFFYHRGLAETAIEANLKLIPKMLEEAL